MYLCVLDQVKSSSYCELQSKKRKRHRSGWPVPQERTPVCPQLPQRPPAAWCPAGDRPWRPAACCVLVGIVPTPPGRDGSGESPLGESEAEVPSTHPQKQGYPERDAQHIVDSPVASVRQNQAAEAHAAF